MGRPKLLLPWRETTVLGHLIATWTQLPAKEIAVVHARGDQGITGELDRLNFPAAARIANPDPDRGMFSSIVCAAQWPGWKSGVVHWAIVLGDQPHLRAATLRSLAEFAATQPGSICQPARHGRPRHPVLLPATVFRQLAASQAATLKDFLQPFASAVKWIELDDPGLDLDMDCPEDYERALRMAGGGS